MLGEKHKAGLQTRSAGEKCESTFGGAGIAAFCVKKVRKGKTTLPFALSVVCVVVRLEHVREREIEDAVFINAVKFLQAPVVAQRDAVVASKLCAEIKSESPVETIGTLVRERIALVVSHNDTTAIHLCHFRFTGKTEAEVRTKLKKESRMARNRVSIHCAERYFEIISLSI